MEENKMGNMSRKEKWERVEKELRTEIALNAFGNKVVIPRESAKFILEELGKKKEAAEASGELKCKCGDTNKEVLEKIERQDAVLAEFIEMCMTFMSLQMTYNMQSVSIMQDKGELEELPEMSQIMVADGLDAMENFVNRLVGTMEDVIKKKLKVNKVKDVDIEELMEMFMGKSGRTDN